MSANERQVGGDHYIKREADGVQHWDLAAMFGLDYFQGVITKYVFRWRDKAGLQDLKKAHHYLEKYIEVHETMQAHPLDAHAHYKDLAKALDALYLEPVPMLLFCPRCRTQHVDKAEGDWHNPPHKSHLCAGCGFVWRQADVPTVGVERIYTQGQLDGDLHEVRSRQHTSGPDFEWEGFKEGNVLYRCAKCRVHFNCPEADTPYNVHHCYARGPWPVTNVEAVVRNAERLGIDLDDGEAERVAGRAYVDQARDVPPCEECGATGNCAHSHVNERVLHVGDRIAFHPLHVSHGGTQVERDEQRSGVERRVIDGGTFVLSGPGRALRTANGRRQSDLLA